jgi:hypothetical protein
VRLVISPEESVRDPVDASGDRPVELLNSADNPEGDVAIEEVLTPGPPSDAQVMVGSADLPV